MPKPNPLSQGLSQTPARQPAPARTTKAEPPQSKSRRPKSSSREGTVLIGGHFAPEVQTALKIIAAQERKQMQELLAEAINGVFASRQKPQIATITTVDE